MRTLGRARALAALALLGVGAVSAVVFVRRRADPVSGEARGAADAATRPGCGQGRADEARAVRVWRRLGEAPEGAQLLASLSRRPRICFADVDPSVVVGADELLLDARLDGDAAAARAGHLVSHVVARDDLDPARAEDCAAFAAKALAAETRAHQLEARLLGHLGDADAAAELAASANQRAAAVADGYRAQCERRRADAGG